MSHLYNIKRQLQRKLPKSYKHKLQEFIYFFLYRLSPARHQNFFNSGYSPIFEEITQTPPFHREPLQATLYYELLKQAHYEDVSGTMLDIGCGLGGGLRLAAHMFPSNIITGVDVSASATNIAKKRLKGNHNIKVIQGNGRALPFEDMSFDFIFSVGTASYIALPEFLEEASRIIKPGGTISFSAGFTSAKFERHKEIINKKSRKLNLSLISIQDITKNVFLAIDEDVERRLGLIQNVPKPFRGYALDWADMPGTPRYQEYVDGQRLDYIAVLKKEK